LVFAWLTWVLAVVGLNIMAAAALIVAEAVGGSGVQQDGCDPDRVHCHWCPGWRMSQGGVLGLLASAAAGAAETVGR